MSFDATAGAKTRLIVGALLLAGIWPLPAHAQLDGLIDRLVRPTPPAYPYYYRPPPPAYAPPYYPPAYRPYYPPVYAPAAPRPAVGVMEAQRTLGALGYDAGAVDGVAGPRVSDAVRAFQRDHGQAADGRLTGETMAALRAALHEREAAPQPATATDEAPSAAAAQATASAGMPTEGRYCRFGPGKSYDMLLVRDAGANLAFGLSSWAPNGSNFSVSAPTVRGSIRPQ